MTHMEEQTEKIETTTVPHTTEVNRVVPTPGAMVVERERPVAAVDRVEAVAYDPFARRRDVAYRVTQFVYWMFGLIEGLVLIRFVLKALGANPAAGFADFIYSVSAPLVTPFYGLFGNPQLQAGAVLELHSLIALIVYALAAWLIARLVWILAGDTRSAIHTHSTSIDSRL